MATTPQSAGQDGPWHVLLDTADLEFARDVVARAYAPHGIVLHGSPEKFRVHQASLERDGMAVDLLTYGSDSDVVPFEPLGAVYCIMHAAEGRLDVMAGSREVMVGPGDSAAIDPDTLFRMHWYDDLLVRNVRVSRELVERRWAALTGNAAAEPPPLQVSPPADRAAAQRWQKCVAFLEQSLAEPGLRDVSDLWWSRLEEYVVHTLMTTHAPTAEPSVSGLRPAAVSRALQHIHDHAGDALVLEDLGEAAGVSRRSLQRAFQQHLGTTPIAYLTQVRLERARADLLDAEPGETTVTDVANRWGFAHHGRFARQFRERFGELPSEALRATRAAGN
ncbi:AraC family transcriptional regulator [Nocardioides rotundus]|uniref:helix-turn-helix transcriptional regulator n=1 Tax=Nocardioides rotundus TaxID=1774216 RepID=UPI001CBE2A81|nr:helix-turn-helix domain-containing protein [Nocardioides rotundus]UAL29665.1 AraC family transcriptional regulator [Nocardioides rotundus]